MQDPPKTIYLYRMVHWENVLHILQNGLCCKGHQDADPNYINIGMRSLIEDRHEHPIPLENAGYLGEYIPFYFAGHSPMLYFIMNGLKGVVQRPQKDIVYIVLDFESVKKSNVSFVFTDRNARIAVANFYIEVNDLSKLNWTYIKSKIWKNDNDHLSRQDLKQAEFMIRKHVPVDCIYALVVKTEERKKYFDGIISNLGLTIKVFIDNKRKLYY